MALQSNTLSTLKGCFFFAEKPKPESQAINAQNYSVSAGNGFNTSHFYTGSALLNILIRHENIAPF